MSRRSGAARRLSRLRARAEAWREGAFLRPVLTLVGGTAAAQAAVFAARPVLTRLYTPEAFGVLTLVTTVAALLSAVAHGGYRYALLLPEDDADAGGLAWLSVFGALATSVLTLLGVSIALRAGWLQGAAWWLLAPALLALDLSQTAEQWLTRGHRFRTISASRVAQSSVVVAIQVGAGIAAAGAIGLVGGAAAGFGVSLAVVGAAVWRADGARLLEALRPDALRALARRYARFPQFSAPAAALNLAATRLPILLLAAFAGEAVVGQFGVAYGTLALPLGLIAGASGQVFFVRAAAAVRDGTLPALTRRTLRGLLAVTVFPSLAVMAAGPSLFAFVFGPTWTTAGQFAQIIAPWTLCASIAGPMTCLFDVLERQRADLGFSVFMATVQTVALVGAGLLLEAPGIVLVASIAGTLLRLGHLGWILRLARVPVGPILRDLGSALAVATPLALSVWAVDLFAGGIWTLVATALGGLITLWTAARQNVI